MKELKWIGIEKDYEKLKRAAGKLFKKGLFEKTLRLIYLLAGLMYTVNQKFYDDKLEEVLIEMGRNIAGERKPYQSKKNHVIFFDGFGNEDRGLMLIYVKALLELGYDISYITRYEKAETIPRLRGELGDRIIYLKQRKYLDQIKELISIIDECGAEHAFLYITPDDVVAVSAFSQYQGKIKRYLINLTDHAFWLGRNAADIFVEFRNYGADISFQERKINKEQLVVLPFYPQIPEVVFKGFPFDEKGKKVIYSGGFLYKTFGEGNLYYQIVEFILKADKDTIFYYTGAGDTTEINKLMVKYPQRVYYDVERSDFYEIMQRCYFYLSTYPYFGGMMTQYAVAAGKLPITLGGEEVIGEQTADGGKDIWYFKDADVLCQEIARLLENPRYLEEREKCVLKGISNPEVFRRQLQKIMTDSKSERPVEWEERNVEKMRRITLERMTKGEYNGLFCRKGVFFALPYVPIRFTKGLFYNIVRSGRKV